MAHMADKRKTPRFRKRYKVNIIVNQGNRTAFSDDISATGIFLRTLSVSQPGSKLQLEIELEPEQIVALEGIVMWAKKVPGNMFHLVPKSGMGIHILGFLKGEEHYLNAVEQLNRK
jgi:hypothetical protein